MIAEIITPLMLATVPLKIDVDKPTYSHVEQKQIQVAQIKQITWNGTQTYNFQGRPSDSDND
jgi:hypothetical protein